jgi:UDP-glucose 4-epimerase
MSNESVLVTGGIGFIGMHVVQQLHELGYRDISIVDNLFKGNKLFLNEFRYPAKFYQMDLNSIDLESVFRKEHFSTVINLAAIHSIPYCISNPLEVCDANIRGTQSIIECCRKFDVRVLFQASSAAVYTPSESPHKEGDPTEPIEIYGVSKLVNESQVRLLARGSSTRCIVGRIFNAVGGFETNEHLIPDLFNRVKSNGTIEVGNLEPVRDYVHVKDTAGAIVQATLGVDSSFEIVNLGNGIGYSVKDVLKLISEVLGRKIEYVQSSKLMRKLERRTLIADNSLFTKKFNWRPKYTFLEALDDAAKYFGLR